MSPPLRTEVKKQANKELKMVKNYIHNGTNNKENANLRMNLDRAEYKGVFISDSEEKGACYFVVLICEVAWIGQKWADSWHAKKSYCGLLFTDDICCLDSCRDGLKKIMTQGAKTYDLAYWLEAKRVASSPVFEK